MKKIVALVGIVAALGLTSCAGPNTAATVGSITITQSEVQNSINEMLAARQAVDTSQMTLQTGSDLNSAELRFKIIVVIFDQIAKELKINITNSELTTMRNKLLSQIGGEANLASNLVAAQIPASEFDTYIRAIVTSAKLTEALKATGVADADLDSKLSQLIIAKAKEMKVVVNPRYGSWDPESTSINPTDSTYGAVQKLGQ